jgi:hypothetical protein
MNLTGQLVTINPIQVSCKKYLYMTTLMLAMFFGDDVDIIDDYSIRIYFGFMSSKEDVNKLYIFRKKINMKHPKILELTDIRSVGLSC